MPVRANDKAEVTMVSLIIDIVIALICLIIIIRNAARGFIRSFMAFARTILAVLLAYALNSPLAAALDEGIFSSMSQGWIHNAFISTYDGEGAYNLYTLFDGIPEWFTNALMRSGVDEQTVQKYFYSGESAPVEVVDQLSTSLGGLLSNLISTILAVIIIFIVVEIVLLLLGLLLNKVGQIPIFRFLNILLGAAIGLVFSAAIAFIISGVAIWIIRFGAGYNASVFTESLISDSIFLNFFNENDIWNQLTDLILG